MSHLWHGVIIGIVLLLTGCSEAGQDQGRAKPGFFVLALTWSPSYCATEGDPNSPQCRPDGPEGFVVHGLWPQFEEGYPEYCEHPENGSFRRKELAALRDLYPSDALIRHQWRKHGSCSGKSRQEYFATVREAWDRMHIPRELGAVATNKSIRPGDVERAFIEQNPGLRGDAIAVTCRDGQLREVRICMTNDLAFRACPEVDRNACRAPNVLIPSLAGTAHDAQNWRTVSNNGAQGPETRTKSSESSSRPAMTGTTFTTAHQP